MSGVPGRLAKLQVFDGTQYVNVGGIVDISHPISVDELETTDHDSDGAREYEPNHHSATMSVSGRWKDGDPGQEIVLDAIFNKVPFLYRYRLVNSIGKKEFVGRAFPTEGDPQGPLDDAAALDMTFRCSGVRKQLITSLT